MEDCAPCGRVKPEWMKIGNIIKYEDPNIIIGDIEQSDLSKVSNLKYKVDCYPTIINIWDNGKKIKSIEEDNIHERNIDGFIKWINNNKNKCIRLIKSKKNKKNRSNKQTKISNKK